MESLKITAIETILDPERPLLVWVRVHTDAGLVGLGESFQSPDAIARVVHGTLAKVLLGQDATRIELLWHHMFKVVKRIDGASLWANNHLLFWLSLVPFATNWMDENAFPTVPVAVYGGILFMCGIAFFLLDLNLRRLNGVDPQQSGACYVLVAGMWFIPDRRLERAAVEK